MRGGEASSLTRKGGENIPGKREGRLFSELKPAAIVGKGGVGKGMLEELRRVAEENHYFKIRVLKSFPGGMEEVAARLEREGLATLLSSRGRVGLFKSMVFRLPGTEKRRR
ncbi:MAG: YhbY family RNA-binding protein [Thermoplasmata archaeon]|nr:YhbY family RNA-binding protein [Thermoplasmata archaeon]